MAESTYRRIADELRRDIVDGNLTAGARIPSRHQLARQYGVSDRVAVEAVRLLTAEGFAESRPGSGTYVRQRPERQRLTRAWYTTRPGGSPFRADAEQSGAAGTWEASTDRAPMTPAITGRLGAGPGQLAMRTAYTFLRDGEPVMLSTSWEPATLTSGTAIMFPEEGPHAGAGVVDRMAVIGQRVIRAEEVVSARAALAAEAERLRIRAGSAVLTIARTYRTEQMAVETADIVLPVERYALVYEIPVGGPELTAARQARSPRACPSRILPGPRADRCSVQAPAIPAPSRLYTGCQHDGISRVDGTPGICRFHRHQH